MTSVRIWKVQFTTINWTCLSLKFAGWAKTVDPGRTHCFAATDQGQLRVNTVMPTNVFNRCASYLCLKMGSCISLWCFLPWLLWQAGVTQGSLSVVTFCFFHDCFSKQEWHWDHFLLALFAMTVLASRSDTGITFCWHFLLFFAMTVLASRSNTGITFCWHFLLWLF